MPIAWETLNATPRLLAQARLRPIQGTRFQPTGFPDLGAARYTLPTTGSDQRTEMLLVESAQSMANRLESVCWDEAKDDLVAPLQGMPYVRVKLWNSNQTTNSILEAHRLNSPYIMNDEPFKDKLREKAGAPKRGRGKIGDNEEERDLGGAGLLDRRKVALAAFHYDPNTALHGVFLEKLDGRVRLQRLLSAFIEAGNVGDAHSGGVKNDRVAPKPSALQEIGLTVRAAEGFGNVPFHRTEYVAETITAYFSLDLAQLRAYGLGEAAQRFLVTLGLWKLRRLLETGMRLRTACDLEVAESGLEVKRPQDFVIPPTAELEAELPRLIRECAAAGLFASPPITELTFAARK